MQKRSFIIGLVILGVLLLGTYFLYPSATIAVVKRLFVGGVAAALGAGFIIFLGHLWWDEESYVKPISRLSAMQRFFHRYPRWVRDVLAIVLAALLLVGFGIGTRYFPY